MAEIWKPKPTEIYQDWIDSVLTEASDELTDWEKNFIDSIQSQLLRSSKLTERQAEILERIYAEKTN